MSDRDEFFAACLEGNPTEVRNFLTAKVFFFFSPQHAFKPDKDGDFALFIAARVGNAEVVDILLEEKAPINRQNKNGETALFVAAQCGYLEIVDALLERDASVELQNKNGETALIQAAGRGYLSIVRALLDKGADINMGGLSAIVVHSLKKGTAADVQRRDGATALGEASFWGHSAVVEELLKRGANIESRCHGNETALMRAVHNGRKEVVDLLIENGANVNHQTPVGESALMIACYVGHANVVSTLLDGGADIGLQRLDGETALHKAEIRENTEIVDLLTKEHVDVDVQNHNGELALSKLNTSCSKLLQNILPEMCFVCAPFNGEVPDDLGDWSKSNQDLMMAGILGVEASDAFDELRDRIGEKGVRTFLIPDIAANEIGADTTAPGAMLDRSLRVMTQKLSLDPEDFEYFTSVFEQDGFQRCSPIGFCFVFKK